MTSAVARGPITTFVLDQLATAGFPVGDNMSPTDPYGWTGQPDGTDQTFIPWLMLGTLTAQPQRQQAIGDTGREWILPYSVFYAGISRKQVEALADRMRNQLCNISRLLVETENGDWQIQKISCLTIGTTNRIGSAMPDYFTQADTFDLWVSKGS